MAYADTVAVLLMVYAAVYGVHAAYAWWKFGPLSTRWTKRDQRWAKEGRE